MALIDANERSCATDPTQSFIVQAPAGSGKTELLTQRYLRLLTTVHEPEQIIALTFTRKAANEMRERILKSLQSAASDHIAQSAHQQQTLEMANAALAHDKKRDWRLLNQPSRLRIITIDALCQTIAQAIPLQDKQTPYASISDTPQQHYLKAAHECLAFALNNAQLHKPITTLLKHVDNFQDRLIELFSQLLVSRAQWIQPIMQARTQDKAQFEQALKIIEQHEIDRLTQLVPQNLQNILVNLSQHTVTVINDQSSPRHALKQWQSFTSLDRKLANSLASLLLTSQNKLRKSFDHHVGLKKGNCSPDEYDYIKSTSKEILESLNEIPDLVESLVRIKHLPDPHYNEEQWQALNALFTLIPILAAHLNVIFKTENEVDFTAIAEQASVALGDDENPTDLALYLDNSIQHLLIDEFQDTSIQQFDLLKRLVHGWERGDGRTIFAVGDPMQSIYRFRSAEVGLFLQAQKNGIGDVKLNPIKLSCNFRSSAAIIHWINHHFQSVFPKINDIESGAITFHPSMAIKGFTSTDAVIANEYQDKEHEAAHIINIVKKELSDNRHESIAILVRSRGQLTDIISCLRQNNIPFQGVNIDLLANLPHLRDVWSLTQALLMPANRLAWLALFRCPWCGITIPDIHKIANFKHKKSILYALRHLDEIEGLSSEGKARARFIYAVMNKALRSRFNKSLAEWIIATLKDLNLDLVLESREQDDLEQYWKLLTQYETAGLLNNMSQFAIDFNNLYSEQVTPSRLQIMTIHKSKGLEFDCVILPGLSKKSPSGDRPIVRWVNLPHTNFDNLQLLSPIKAAHHERCKIYDFIGRIEQQKDYYEAQRLLYVAVTRAKSKLYLTDNNHTKNTNTFRGLLSNQPFTKVEESTFKVKANATTQILKKLPLNYLKNPENILASTNTPPALNHDFARQIGIITHELLQWICTSHPESPAKVPWHLIENKIRKSGVDNLQDTLATIQKWIGQLYSDPKGQWIIKPHQDEKNEFEILIKENDEIKTRIIDRTFYENGTRWIIDYKTGHEDSQKIAQYTQQLEQYAGYLANIFNEEIKCGLYFLETNYWHEIS